MSARPGDRLYQLLPSFYRSRDALEGEPLRALLRVLEAEFQALEDDISRLYDDWFIETCQEWVVPYLGDLLGARPLIPVDPTIASQRAYVANTLAYRRGKGTASVLEQLARDVTGWPARVVESFQRLATTQHVGFPRPGHLHTPDMRRAGEVELAGSPFETVNRSVEVRRVDSGRGRYSLSGVGVFLWRLSTWPVERALARKVEGQAGCYRFSPLGQDMPLFNDPRSETRISQLAGEPHVPGRLRRHPLQAELEARRAALARGAPHEEVWFASPPVLAVFLDGASAPVAPERLLIADLSCWRRPPASLRYPNAQGLPEDQPITVAVDPVTGRLAFPEGVEPRRVEVSYSYGFSGEVGGGAYERPGRPSASGARKARGGGALPVVPVVGEEPVLIELTDSDEYTLEALEVSAGARLELRAANRQRPVLRVRREGCAVKLGKGAALVLDGLLVRGGALRVAPEEGASLSLCHCTLVPGLEPRAEGEPETPKEASLSISGAAAGVSVSLERCITGPLRPSGPCALRLVDSIVDGGEHEAIGSGSGVLHIERCTVLGTVSVEVLELASDTLFTGAVQAVRTQRGCVRFSYMPSGSRVPNGYRCQPAYVRPDDRRKEPEAIPMGPHFSSVRYGDPGYCQLRETTHEGIRRGASDQGELGVFHHLRQPQREINLRVSLEEHLRLGLEARIFYVT